MMTLKRLGITTILVLFSALLVNVEAQTPPIEVTTDNHRVQFVATGQAMHVEVFSRSGELVFEQDSAAGQSVTWQMVNEEGARAADGVYLATIAVTDSSGKRRKRIEQIILNHETQPKEVLSANASINRATADPMNSDASMQAVSFRGDSINPIVPAWRTGNAPAISTKDANTTTPYNIGSPRALSVPAAATTFYGQSAGQTGDYNSFFGYFAGHNTTGTSNSFFGTLAGFLNKDGIDNAFFGRGAGQNNMSSSNSFFGHIAGLNNTNGFQNAFFGAYSGKENKDGNSNAFFGASAGSANVGGSENAFFGRSAGQSNGTGSRESFFGMNAGLANTTGENNSLFGQSAGAANRDGSNNAFFGQRAGASNISGSWNTFIGTNAGGSDQLTNATAIGANAYVSQSNSLVLGSTNTNVGIGTPEPKSNLHVATGYVQLPYVTGAPPPGDCTEATAGRMVVVGTDGGVQLHICAKDLNPLRPGLQPGWVIK